MKEPLSDSGFRKCERVPIEARERSWEAYRIRVEAARFQKNLPWLKKFCSEDALWTDGKNSCMFDEALLKEFNDLFAEDPELSNWDQARFWERFSKGLPHNELGEVEVNAYKALLFALKSGYPEDFEAVPLGGVTKLANPQAAYAFELVGPDSHHLGIPASPEFSSAQTAGEMAEVYWHTLARDVSFVDYDTSPIIQAAAEDLSRFTDFRGPKMKGEVTSKTLFRGDTPGDLQGPYISQFLWLEIPFGATTVVQKYRTTVAGDDHLTQYEDWLYAQNGLALKTQSRFDPAPRYIRNGRDLGEWVHRDFSCQGPLGAGLILMGFGPKALSPSNPYAYSKTQGGFGTFGSPVIVDFVSRSSRPALLAAWYQKWLKYNRLRPEEFAGRVHNLLSGKAKYPIHSELLNSPVLSSIFNQYHNYLLPLAYPEGCPTHPAYPAGHACIAGAGVTMLKAFFQEDFVIPNPVVASTDGLSLAPYSGPPLTIGGELNKLAANIALGRDFAGVHWRSDGIEGLKLGEAVAIGILQDYSHTYNENFKGFTFTKFDGTKITI